MKRIWIDAAAAALGGVVATWLMRKSMKLSEKQPDAVKPAMPERDPGDYMVSQAERVTGPLSPTVHEKAAHSLSWVYGIGWPIAFGLIARKIGAHASIGRALGAGAALGAIVWTVGYLGWLPLTGLAAPIHRQPIGRSASSLLSHVLWGSVAATPLAIKSRILA